LCARNQTEMSRAPGMPGFHFTYALKNWAATELVCRALGNALHRKRKNETPIFHSDRGSQYSSNRYQVMLTQNKIRGSMSKVGYPYDNSPMESFFASLKKEYFYRREYATIQDIERDLFYYIEVFYNRKRLHSSLGYMSPVAYRMKEKSQKAG
ncbi:MAG: DDE-type integrase/transposase/recombinase, partial [Lachnospiraceae bacterium]|nr:DDE-type integrase/transposase/recombinase [Lachnospiraceae bacterium]